MSQAPRTQNKLRIKSKYLLTQINNNDNTFYLKAPFRTPKDAVQSIHIKNS